ncbi:MAG TPA: gamma-glutamylcyclotransferase family protein [Opitutaceae bacterium]|jgi:gamma-glutamylcyclotransferase (GGCT)/AIG2-like uncharacterized protein YtfP
MAVIFVYGTLKENGENHRYLEGQVFLGEAATESSYKLYQLDDYPGLVEAAAGGVAVAGELWEVDDFTLRRIDVLEGTKVGLYRRGLVRLLAPNEDIEAETYFYLRSVEGREELPGAFDVQPQKQDPHEILGAHRSAAHRPPSAKQISIEPKAETDEPAPLD